MAIARQLLSASTNGKAIKVVATASTGTTIHTAVSGTTSWDQVWVWASAPTATAAINLTLEWGGTTSPDNLTVIPIPPAFGQVLVVPGWLLNNSLVFTAFAGSANLITLTGYVDRIT